jgi:hypothetical protein
MKTVVLLESETKYHTHAGLLAYFLTPTQTTTTMIIIIILIIIETMICLFQDECMMDHETDGDGAINLSTSQRPSAATTPNGNIEYDEQDQVSTIAHL